MVFQFLMVRLKVTDYPIPELDSMFQFLMVRLKVNLHEQINRPLDVSIPYGTIKSL